MGNYPRIDSYDIAAKYFAGSRSQKDGRPLCAGTRLVKDEEGYVITRYRIPVCRITPDNHVTFIVPEGKLRSIAASLSCTLHKVLPFYIVRIGVGRYKLHKLRHVEYCSDVKTAGDEMFFGTVFNLSTGECVNPMPPKEPRKIDEDKRKVWLQRRKTFDEHLSLFARMGVIDGHISTFFPLRANIPYSYGYATDPDVLAGLKDVFMRDGVPTKELLISAVKAEAGNGRHTVHFVVAYIKRIVRRESVMLREALGVFI